MLYWIALPIAGISFAVLATTIALHWKEIRLLDPDSIKEERVRQKREQLIQRRFDRVKSDKLAPIKALSHKGIVKGKEMFHAAYIRLVRLDRFYKQAKAPFALLAPSAKDRIRTLLDEARSLARDLKWADAERRFLEALALDERNLDAYKGLATIYLKQKLYPQAAETFEFLLRTKQADAGCYEGMGEIAEAQGDMAKAEGMYLKALELQPRLAHRHAVLADFYLKHGDAGKAWPPAKRATDLEPKSGKYLELSIEASIRMGQREEARRRYDKLRLLSEDRPKLQALKERIDRLADDAPLTKKG